jgi:hypothetical protein
MPLLSRRRRAVSAISRGRKSQLCAKGVHQIEDEYIDIDDDRVSNFVDIDEEERGNKHKNDQGHVLNLQCNWCKGKVTNAERQKGIEEGYINRKCCMSYVLANEPDFLAQEEWLTQVVHEAGFEIIFYPKYHCELAV